VTVHVRNFRNSRQRHRLELHTPAGIDAQPKVLEGELPRSSGRSFPIQIRAATDVSEGTHLVGLDVTLDGRRYGEWFDFVVGVH
jgi:hypothetical protein